MITSIGEFEVKEELGHGGMGRVYRAYDPRVGRDVAIKVLSNEGDGDLLARFRSEAGTTAKLTHKNIVTVYAYGEQDGMPYIVMELLQGEDLGRVIRNKRPMPLLEKLRVLHQVADGLAYAHQNNIIHRDIKPGNIMVLPDGTAKIMDFGIARVTGSDSTRRTQKGFFLGTIAYMAPEQFKLGMDADHLVDIFAYGDVAYELIGGEHPFGGGDPGTIMFRITSVEPKPVRDLAPECPELLASILQQLLAKDRDLRYQTLRDVLLDMEPVLFQLRHERAAEVLLEAQPLVAEGQTEPALVKVKEALELDPMNREADRLKRQLQQVLQRKAVRGRVEGILADAELKIAQRSFAEAISLLENAYQLEKTDATRQRLEEVRHEQEKVRRAIQLLGEARLDTRQGNLLAAHAKVIEAISEDPYNTQAVHLDKRLREQLDERATRVREAVERANDCVARDDFAGASQILSEAAEREGESPELAEGYRRVREAEAVFEQRQRRQSFEAAVRAAHAEIAAGNPEQARGTIEQIATGYPDLAVAEQLSELRAGLASLERHTAIAGIAREVEALARREQFAEAHARLDAGQASYPGETTLERAAAELARAQAAWERACAIARAAEDIDRLRSQGELERALGSARAAAAEFPEHAAFAEMASQAEAAILHRRLDDFDRAVGFARAELAAGRLESARAAIERLAAHADLPGAAQTIQALGAELAHLERETEIAGITRAAAELTGREQFAEARTRLDAGLGRYPGDPKLANALAELERTRAARERANAITRATEKIVRLRAQGDLEAALDAALAAYGDYPAQPVFQELVAQIDGDLREQQRRARIDDLVRQGMVLLVSDPFRAAALAHDAIAELGSEKELEGLLAAAEKAAEQRSQQQAIERILASVAALRQSRNWRDAQREIEAGIAQYPRRSELRAAEAELSEARAQRLRSLTQAIEKSLDAKDFKGCTARIGEASAEFYGETAIERLAAALAQAQREQELADLTLGIRQRLSNDDLEGAGRQLEAGAARFGGDAEWRTLRAEMEQRRSYLDALEMARQLGGEAHFGDAEQLLREAMANPVADARAGQLLATLERARVQAEAREWERREAEARERARIEEERKAAEAREQARIEEERRAAEVRERARIEEERQERERKAAEERERARKEKERKAAEARERARQEKERKAAEALERARLEEERKAAEARESARQEEERKAWEARELARQEEERKAAEVRERERAERQRKAVEWVRRRTGGDFATWESLIREAHGEFPGEGEEFLAELTRTVERYKLVRKAARWVVARGLAKGDFQACEPLIREARREFPLEDEPFFAELTRGLKLVERERAAGGAGVVSPEETDFGLELDREIQAAEDRERARIEEERKAAEAREQARQEEERNAAEAREFARNAAESLRAREEHERQERERIEQARRERKAAEQSTRRMSSEEASTVLLKASDVVPSTQAAPATAAQQATGLVGRQPKPSDTVMMKAPNLAAPPPEVRPIYRKPAVVIPAALAAAVFVYLLVRPSSPSLHPSPARVSLTCQGSVCNPAEIDFGDVAGPYSASTGAPWLSVYPAAGDHLTRLQVAAKPGGLAAKGYDAAVKVTAGDSHRLSATVPVHLEVRAGAAPVIELQAQPASLQFDYRNTDPPPAAKEITLPREQLAAVRFSWMWPSGKDSGWARCQRSRTALNVSIETKGMRIGQHTATLVLDLPGAANSPQRIPVTIDIRPFMTIQ